MPFGGKSIETTSVAVELVVPRYVVSLREFELTVTTCPLADADTPMLWRSVLALIALASPVAIAERLSPDCTV